MEDKRKKRGRMNEMSYLASNLRSNNRNAIYDQFMEIMKF